MNIPAQPVTIDGDEYAALKRDAARYRFLRDSANAYPLCFIAQRAAPPNVVVQFTGNTADANIDALMEKERRESAQQ